MKSKGRQEDVSPVCTDSRHHTYSSLLKIGLVEIEEGKPFSRRARAELSMDWSYDFFRLFSPTVVSIALILVSR